MNDKKRELDFQAACILRSMYYSVTLQILEARSLYFKLVTFDLNAFLFTSTILSFFKKFLILLGRSPRSHIMN